MLPAPMHDCTWPSARTHHTRAWLHTRVSTYLNWNPHAPRTRNMHAQGFTSVHAARPEITRASPCPAGAHTRVHPTSTSTHKSPARPGLPLPLCRRARAPGARLRVRGAGCGTNVRPMTTTPESRSPLDPPAVGETRVPQCVTLGCAHLALSKLRQRWRRRP